MHQLIPTSLFLLIICFCAPLVTGSQGCECSVKPFKWYKLCIWSFFFAFSFFHSSFVILFFYRSPLNHHHGTSVCEWLCVRFWYLKPLLHRWYPFPPTRVDLFASRECPSFCHTVLQSVSHLWCIIIFTFLHFFFCPLNERFASNLKICDDILSPWHTRLWVTIVPSPHVLSNSFFF